MSIKEALKETWEKRFMQAHYNYRDFHTVATGDDPTAAAATYVFGTNARAINRDNWPNPGDWPLAGQCYARSIMVQCTQDAWVIITSLNPHYLMLLAQGYTAAQIIALGISLTITETPMFIPATALIIFEPTYGSAITFYQSTVSGTIRIWADVNVDGNE